MSFEPLTVALAAQSEALRKDNERLEWENQKLRHYHSKHEGLLQAICDLMNETSQSAMDEAIVSTIEDLLGQPIDGWTGPDGDTMAPIENVYSNKRFAINKIKKLEIVFETL